MSCQRVFISIVTAGLMCAGLTVAAYAAGPVSAAPPAKPAAAPAPAAAKPAPAPATPAKPAALATADGETQGLRLEVTQLKRAGSDAMMLKFTVYNDSDKEYNGNEFHKKEYNSTDGVYLVDLEGKKKYEVVKDSDGNCVCSRSINSIASHFTAVLWARFGAPPATTTKLSVTVPHFTPMDDVPLSQ